MKPNLTWLDDPEIFRVGQLAAHSDHQIYNNYSEIQQQNSSFVQSLNGQCQFKFSSRPQQRPQNFYKTDFDTSSFEYIKVLQHIELVGFSQIQYINTFYPWEGKEFRRPPYTLDSKRLETGLFSQASDNHVGSYIKF